MCGIAGFWGLTENSRASLNGMAEKMNHRGPDARGIWQDENAGVGFAHVRLSILDLSDAGSQPMFSPSGRYVAVFNGEVYNHLELRRELDLIRSRNWRGHSDTETILTAIEEWGLTSTLSKMVGMFALVLWDKSAKTMWLARDRMGEKPLYWGWMGKVFIFGSELKVFKVLPDFKPEIDRGALALLLRHAYIPAPYTIYRNIQKLKPGHYLKLNLAEFEAGTSPMPQAYWSIDATLEQSKQQPFAGDVTDAIAAVKDQLQHAVEGQMLSDVPLGAFLSGGIDSSTIVALMQAKSSRPVKTFTIGFNEGNYNEAEHAKSVAKHLGTDHTELYLSQDDILQVVPRLPAIYSEPFADSSQIPTFLVSEMASKHVSVALSGDGGDEFFGGYNRYMAVQKIWRPTQAYPKTVRKSAAKALSVISPTQWDKLSEMANPWLPKKYRLTGVGEKIRKLSELLAITGDHSYFQQLTSQWMQPEEVVIGAEVYPTLILNPEAWPATDSLEHTMMALDAQTYLTDDILVKVDRAAMANSLETRVPFLDHRLVELVWRMPLNFKIREGQGKWLIRQILYEYVPKALIERPKAGFAIPLAEWLRGPLRDWAEMLLDANRLKREGYFHAEPIRVLWEQHLKGTHNWQYQLWNVLMFQAWLEEEHK